jgi:protein-disulfide isomerase
MPLAMHSKAQAAHEAAEAAHQQGKFWEMHDRIFENQRAMSPENYLRYADELKLDVEKFKRDLSSEVVKTRIENDLSLAQTLDVTGTPTFFINGRYLSGAQPLALFKRAIDKELAKK